MVASLMFADNGDKRNNLRAAYLVVQYWIKTDLSVVRSARFARLNGIQENEIYCCYQNANAALRAKRIVNALTINIVSAGVNKV